MNTMAPISPTELHACRVHLTPGPAAAAEARGQVRAVICAWRIPVDPDIAVLLTSDLVTNVIRHVPDETVTLAIRCALGHLRVDVHGTPRSVPVQGGPFDAETERGLILVAALSDAWGSYRTPAGRAVYFALAFQPDLAEGGERDPA
jgi:hypothetical protein